MKLYKSLLMFAVAAIAFCSCSEEGYWEPYDTQSVPTYSFAQASNKYSLSGLDSLPEVVVSVYRNNDKGTVTIPLSVTLSDTEVMSVDTAAVTFYAGKSTADFVITIDESKIKVGKTYTANLAIVPDSVNLLEENLSITGNSTFKLTFSKAYTFTSAGKVLYTEDMVTTFFGVQNLTYEVEVEKAIGNPAVIRLVDPYGAAYPYNAPGDYDTSKKHYMLINMEDPEGVYFERHYSGMDWGYGEFIFHSYAGYYLEKGNPLEAIKAAGYCGVVMNNKIIFPAGTLLIGMADYNGGGLYTANGNGAFCIDLSTADLSE